MTGVHHRLECLAIASLLVVFAWTQVTSVQAQGTARISGVVVDLDNEPVDGAVVGVLASRYFENTVTDSTGRFDIVVDREGWFTVYAMCDRPETSGVDYVPAEWSTYVQFGSASSFRFVLVEGASIHLYGDIWFVESSRPADYSTFTVEGYETPLPAGSSIVTYGDGDLVRRFGFDERLVIVPADTEVKINVDAQISYPTYRLSHGFTVAEKTGYFKLSQGENLHCDIRESNMLFNFDNVKALWDSSLSLLEDTEDAGFLVNLERQDLLNAYKMIMESLFTLNTGSYDESFAKIRSAYILTTGSMERLHGLTQISSQSALLLLFVFVFIASSCAYLIAERGTSLDVLATRGRFSISINLLIAVALYVLLVASFYALFAGCRLVPQGIFIGTSIALLIMGQAAVAFSPRLLSERKSEQRSIRFGSAIIVAFSMACRNLRRRKMRTILSLTNIAILVFGFITFTSISPGYGLVTQSLRPNLAIDALLVRDDPVGSDILFLPLPASFLPWLESQPNVTVISPKAENTPISMMGEPLGYLYSRAGASIVVFGILGIVPSLEADLTLLNETVVEGDYLEEDDLNGVLIASSLQESSGVAVGDKLYGFQNEFTIRGFFDQRALESHMDIDGKTIIPYWIEPDVGPVPCRGDTVIMLFYEKALTLPRVFVSRVTVQLENPEDYSSLARIIALTREYKVYISHPGSLHLESVQSYVEEKGAGLTPFLMLIAMLNIAVSMLGSVRERKDEISSLSSVGLNPTHIAALFIAEAAIIGFVGGGFGYLSGIFGYRVASVTLFGALQVREKVSAEWGLIALLVSGCTAILASLMPALQASTIVTPSLLRKWSLRQSVEPREEGKPWAIDLPIKLFPKELEPFMGFILKRMHESAGEVTDLRLQEEVANGGPLKRLIFRFSSLSDRKEWSENELLVERTEGRHCDLRLLCTPSTGVEDTVHRTASYVRRLVFEWNATEFQVATPFDPSLSQLYTLVNAYTPSTLYIATTELDVGEKLEPFKRALVVRGLRPPRIVISRVKALDVEQTMKTAEELVSRADVICISGEPASLSSALAMNAARQNKITCYVIDPRSNEQRIRNPYESLKIVNVT